MLFRSAKNLTLSEEVLAVFGLSGYALSPEPYGASVVILNTCGFISEAREEGRAELKKLAELRKKGLIRMLVVYGCMVQGFSEEMQAQFPDVDLFVGSAAPDKLFQLVHLQTRGVWLPVQWKTTPGTSAPRLYSTPPSYAYLKISDGCDNRCAYCSIPRLRGPMRSRAMGMLLREAVDIVRSGRQEIVLIAQDLASFGKDRGGSELVELVRKLSAIDELAWIRLLYIHPANLTDDMFQMFAEGGKVVPYIDIPVQHLHDKVLASMGRPGKYEHIKRVVSKLRQVQPDIALRTSIITGYPTEGDEEFAVLRDRLAELDFTHLGVFTYSHETDTVAWDLGDPVPASEKESRRSELMAEQMARVERRNQGRVGSQLTVIVDGVEDSEEGPVSICRSGFEAPDVDPVVFVAGEFEPGEFIEVEVVGVEGYDLVGEALYDDEDDPEGD